MSWRLARSLKQLQTELDQRFPTRTKPDWTIGDAAHRRRASDHNPNPQGVVCAIDVRGKEVAALLTEHIRRTRDPRIKYVIFNSRIFSSYDHSQGKAYTWRPFGGHPHSDHAHISVGRGRDGQSTRPDLYDSTSSWGLGTVAKEEDEDMTELVKHLQTTLNEAEATDYEGKPLKVDGVWGKRTQSAFVKALSGGGSEGLTQKQADGRYARKGTEQTFKLK